MSENLVIVSKVENVKRRFNLKANELCRTVKTPSIVSGGDLAWVCTSKDPTTLQTMSFGFTPHRSETRIDMLISFSFHTAGATHLKSRFSGDTSLDCP